MNEQDRGRTKALPRVVQIGFHKCGTRSFQRLFEGAGLPVVQHKVRRPFRITRNAALLMRENVTAGRKVFAGIEDYVLYAGLVYQTENDSVEGNRFFREIIRDYPDTILLLNLRDREDWIRSRLKHGHGEFANRVLKQRGMTDLTALADEWRAEWDAHISAVREFMGTRPQQLVEFNLDTDSIEELVDRLPGYGLNPDHWGDVGRTRGIKRNKILISAKRWWAHHRWRSRL